ncbi:hypothetical protein SLS64_004484 [Diaporthe eres]|uniref:protein-ribulosamine 3-kinase n=1 Tax=Diaporthe eres TaxID=83184 RepID=A0ABR1PK20_DIAER
MVPKPVGWGKYEFTDPDTFYLIEDFHHLDGSVPSPQRVAQRLVQLHSLVSPNAKFGFAVPTHQAIAPHPEGWESSWTVYFTRVLKTAVDTDTAKNGNWPELSKAAEHLLEAVVPILLDPLQRGPNPIKPRLIHGDIWAGNIGTDKKTGHIMFVDTGSFYGHNELDLGAWRRPRAENLGQPYLDEYKRIFQPSEPQDGFDDRNRLYSLKFDLNVAACEGQKRFRNAALNNMLYLIEKYSKTSIPGLPKYDPSKDYSAGISSMSAIEQSP